jgi:ribosomal protein S18 acetylase RimI-like enzyme
MLEPANFEDHPVVVTIVNRAYRGTGDHRGWNSEADLIAGDRVTLDHLRQDLADNPDAALMVHRGPGGEVRACVRIEPEDEPEKGNNWYFGMLAIDPAVQADGLGKQMLMAIDAHVRERGGRRIRITVINLREALIAWYERRGFVRTGEVEPLPEDIGTPLRENMNFVVLAKDL